MEESCAGLSEAKPLYLKAKTFQCTPIHMHIPLPDLSKGLSFEIQKDKHVFEMDRCSLRHFRNLSPFHTRILTLKLRLSLLFTCEALCVLPALERTMSLLLLTAESGLGIDERKLELEMGVPCAWDLVLRG